MRRRHGSAVLVLGLAAMLLAGCTSSTGPADSSASTVPRPARRPPRRPAARRSHRPVAPAGWSSRTVQEIRDAVASASPGQVIQVADGEYEFKPRLVASASGTADAPITLTGSRQVIFRTKNASGDYGLSITGDFWRIEGITVAHASKGIVLDGSVGTVIDNVEVFDVGDEAVHFRACSSDGVLRNSFIHDTGRNSPQYGEGVYVGSANSNWSKYECTDAEEGVAGRRQHRTGAGGGQRLRGRDGRGRRPEGGHGFGHAAAQRVPADRHVGAEQCGFRGRRQGQQLGHRGQFRVGDRCRLGRRRDRAAQRIRRRLPIALGVRGLRDGKCLPPQYGGGRDSRVRDRAVPGGRQYGVTATTARPARRWVSSATSRSQPSASHEPAPRPISRVASSRTGSPAARPARTAGSARRRWCRPGAPGSGGR